MYIMITLPVSDGSTYEVNPSKIIALGLNYHAHIQESESVRVQGFTKDIPPEPILFAKTPNSLVGPGEEIVLPAIVAGYGFENPRTDHEAELAFFIGRDCKNIEPEEAYDYIYGFTCSNDVSQRNIQNADRSGWFRGKSFDTFAPVGPCVVLSKDLGDPQELAIECRVNGAVTQSGNTAQMIFGVPQMLSFISKNFSLVKGDLILTGTPSGVGPLKHGDLVEVEIEKIGVLRNPVRDATHG